MTLTRDQFVRLRTALATLYPTEASSRIVADDVGLEPARIAFSSVAVNNWQAILKEAEHSGRLHDLITRARSDYPDYDPLAAVEQDLQTGSLVDLPNRLPASPVTRQVNSAVLRELLNAAFTDEHLGYLLYDHFRSVYDDLSAGAGKAQKIQRLVEYSEQNGQTGRLLDLIKERNAFQYNRFAARLFS